MQSIDTTLDVVVGKTFEISLPGKATAWAAWTLTASDPSISALGMRTGEFTPSKPMVCGAEADNIFSFHANRAGTFTITAELRPAFGATTPVYETRVISVLATS